MNRMLPPKGKGLTADQVIMLLDMYRRKPHPENHVNENFVGDLKVLVDHGWVTKDGPVGDRCLTPEGVYMVSLIRRLACFSIPQLYELGMGDAPPGPIGVPEPVVVDEPPQPQVIVQEVSPYLPWGVWVLPAAFLMMLVSIVCMLVTLWRV